MAKTSDQRDRTAGIEGERRRLVLVFVDVVGSTRLSTQMDSEDFADLMLEFQQLGRGVFEAYGGSVAHYLGDGLLVCFGYPQERENDAERAVRAAFDLLGQLRDRHTGRTSEPLQARVGVHTGTVVVGTGKDGEGGILLGEAVNVAARIQSAAEPDTVFASNEALDLLKGKFASRAQDPVTLKGVAQQVVLHHIRRPASSKPTHPTSAVTMVGRGTALDHLKEAMADARQGVRTGVSITGEPGLGKTTLINAFRAALGDEPHIWLEARCDVLQTGAALHPFIDLARKSLGILSHHSVDDAAHRLRDGLAIWSDRPQHALPVIARLLGIPVSERAMIATESPERLRTLTLQTLAAWIAFLATGDRWF